MDVYHQYNKLESCGTQCSRDLLHFCASASNAAGDGEKSGQVEGYFLQSDLIYVM